MAEETLEQKVNSEKNEDKKSVSTIDSVIGEFGDLFNLGVGVAAPAAGYALTGNAGVPVVSAAFVAGSGGNLTSKKIRNESLVGTIWGTILHYFTLPLKYMSNFGKAAYAALLPFASNSICPTADHLINNKSPKGLYEKLKKNYWPNVKKTFKTIWPLNLLATLFLSQPAYIVGAIGVANYLFRKYVIGGKGEEEKDKTPYSAAAANVSYKLAKTAVSPLHALYEIGSGLYKSAPKQAVSPKPAQPAEPATQHA